MAWSELRITSWVHFQKLANALTDFNPHEVTYLFRGQSDASWKLEPSLIRLVPQPRDPETLLTLERVGLQRFQAQAHLHVPAQSLPFRGVTGDTSLAEWWAMMQHHHAPTRLLDWTASPFVAAYFAVENHWNLDGSIHSAHVGALTREFNENYGRETKIPNSTFLDPTCKSGLLIYLPEKQTERLVAQQGFFTLSVNVTPDHETSPEAAANLLGEEHVGRVWCRKFVIPAELKPEFLFRLQAMNITAQNLFPGLDGLGRGIGELARLVRARSTARVKNEVEKTGASGELDDDQARS